MTAELAAKPNYPLPISNGILEHREKIGAAIWLFILLIDKTTCEESGVGKVLNGKPIKTRELMDALSLKRRQVGSQLKRLNAGGYIRLKRAPYGYSIEVMKSKKFINRDKQKVASHTQRDAQEIAYPDAQKVAHHNGEMRNNVPIRCAESCACNKDLTVDLTNKNSASRKKRERADTDPRVKTLLTAFVDNYLARVASRPVITGKEAVSLKRLLTAGHDVPAIEAAMDRYFADKFYSETGFDAAGFAKAFNRLNSAGAMKKHNYDEGSFPAL